MKRIAVQREVIDVVLGSMTLRNELSLINYRIGVSKLRLDVKQPEHLELIEAFVQANKRASIDLLVIDAIALLGWSKGYSYERLHTIRPKKLEIRWIEYDFDISELPSSVESLSLQFFSRP